MLQVHKSALRDCLRQSFRKICWERDKVNAEPSQRCFVFSQLAQGSEQTLQQHTPSADAPGLTLPNLHVYGFSPRLSHTSSHQQGQKL